MKMVLDDAGDLNVVSAYSPGEVRIRGEIHATRLLVLPRRLERERIPATVDELCEETLTPVIESGVGILILGTGERQHFPPPHTLASLMRAQVGYEIMDNAAACRTFNILLGEGREAALLLLDDPD
jgi:uncharacterized protein